MKKKKMILAAVVLLLVFMVGGAIAYFTDTDSKTNTFTIGSVDISLSEPSWVAENGQNVMPGQNIAKDPTITNESTTNTAYVFAKVEIPCSTDESPIEVFTLTTIGEGWNLMTDGACDNGKATKIYNYGTDAAMTSLAASASTTPVFSSVTVNSAIDGSQAGLAGDLNVVVTGYGIQTDGLASTTPTAVWANFS